MGIFTKLLVVLVAVASLLLVGLLSAYVSNSTKYKALYQGELARRVTAESNAANAEADLAAQGASANQRIQALQGEVSQLQVQLTERDAASVAQARQIIELSAANDDVRTQLASLSSGLEQQTQINGMLTTEVGDRRERNVELAQRNIEVNDRNQELNTQVATLNRQVRLLQERVVDLETVNENMARDFGAAPRVADSADGGPAQTAIEPDRAIMGRVTNVDNINGEVFVALNVGRNDSVSEGMKFIIHRGDTYLGNAIINLVDENESSARVVLRRGDITPNDEAYAGSR